MASNILSKNRTMTVINAGTVPKNSSLTSDPIDLSNIDGDISVEWEATSTTGTAAMTVAALLSVSGKNFPKVSTLATAFTKTSGDNSDGTGFATIQNTPCQSGKIKLTETANSADMTVSVWLAGR